MSPLLAAHEHFRDMGPWEWVTAVAAAVACIWSIWLAVRYTLRPGETEPDHVKRSILDDGPWPGPTPSPPAGPPPPAGRVR